MAYTAKELYKVDMFKKGILEEMFKYYPKDLELLEEPGQYEIYVHDISPSAAGIYQVGQAARFFGLDLEEEISDLPAEERAGIEGWEDYEWGWDTVEDAATKIADELNDIVNLPGSVYFGHLPDEGSYGLLYVWETGDHPKFDKLAKTA